MRGSWVISPQVLVGRPGPSIKYNSSLMTKRILWASPAFRSAFPATWLVLLEIVAHCKNRWTLLSTAEQWALARASAEKKAKPSEVLALVDPSEAKPHLKHVFATDDFVQFIASVDVAKGSIGLLNM